MKILHTSDWHLGRTLYGRKRDEEFAAFLDWLLQTLESEQVEALLIAGDIFDTSTPSHRAQSLYYRFLCRVAASSCRHVVVIAGNHDSPSFLEAPRELLQALQVHVIGQASEDGADEVLVLQGADGQAELLVCAVPYLRDRDVRVAEAGESLEEKEQKLAAGIREHYAQVAAQAEARREELGAPLPLVAMGHLFTAGGQTVEGDGVRELYVGSLAHVAASIFPPCFDYVALGHLHVPQKVGGLETRRYSGSPLPMGFGEAKQQKSVCLVSVSGAGSPVSVELLPVPVFQRLEKLAGDWAQLEQRLQELRATGDSVWLEVVYEGHEVLGDLRERLDELVQDSPLEILRVKNRRAVERVLEATAPEETLDDLEPQEVFERCLKAEEVPAEQWEDLRGVYQEALASLLDAERQVEQ